MLTTEARIAKLFSASPETLKIVDDLLEGNSMPPLRSLRLLMFGEVAKLTGLSRTTIWRLVRDGRLKSVEIREGNHRVPLDEVERLVTGRARK